MWGVYRPMRNVFHFYIDAVCIVFLFMYMPVTLIASETEREREIESESSKFYEVPFDPKILRYGWGVYRPMNNVVLHSNIDAVCIVVLLCIYP